MRRLNLLALLVIVTLVLGACGQAAAPTVAPAALGAANRDRNCAAQGWPAAGLVC